MATQLEDCFVYCTVCTAGSSLQESEWASEWATPQNSVIYIYLLSKNFVNLYSGIKSWKNSAKIMHRVNCTYWLCYMLVLETQTLFFALPL